MSTQIEDKNVFAVQITLKHVASGDPLTIWLGRDYYDENEVDTGVGQVFPVLATPYTIVREVGRYAQVQANVSVDLYGDIHCTAFGESLQTLRASYAFIDADVTFWLWRKPTHGQVLDDSGSKRLVGKVIDVDYNSESGLLRLVVVDSFGFKQQTIGRKFEESIFQFEVGPNLDERNIGLYGGYPFSDSDNGETAIVNAPVISENVTPLVGGHSENTTYGNIFCGWNQGADFPVEELVRVYAENNATEFVKTPWVPTALPTETDEVFFVTETDTWFAGSATTYSLRDLGPVAQLDSVRNKLDSLGRVITHVAIGIQYILPPEEPADRRSGNLTIEVFHSETQVDMESIAPRGRRLATATIDNTDAVIGGTKSIILVPLSPWIVSANDGFLTDFSNLMFTLTWSNENSTADLVIFKDAETNFVHYERGSADERAFEKIDDERIAFEAFFLTGASALTNETFALPGIGTNYARYSMHTVEQYGTSGAPQTPTQELSNIDWKVAVKGLRDTAGEITTSADQPVTRPPDVIAFVLKYLLTESPIAVEKGNTEFVLGDDFNMSFTLEDYDAHEFIMEVCRHGRMVVYIARDGELTLHAPQYVDPLTITTEYWSQFHGEDFYIVDIEDNQETQIVNAIKCAYDPDFLVLNGDPAVLRTAQGNQLKKEIIINSERVTQVLDTTRKAQAAASEARYGRRETTESFPFFKGLHKALGISQYIFDRYHELQKQAMFELPNFVENRVINFFDNIRLGAAQIPDDEPTFDELRVHEEYDPVIAYDQGVRAFVVNYGTIHGQVVRFEESESFGNPIRVVIETVSEFVS